MPVGKTLHVISLYSNRNLRMGRGHDADVRIADISVSRYHAILKFDEDRRAIVLQDHNSKFGTLRLIQRPKRVKFDEFVDTHVQAGRTLLQIHLTSFLKETFFTNICCCYSK
mmetsp:Transcript_29153/g.21696  ORF Transcript_29153/g.21696 Transcript_29153/m.21696 type:complete len:112 (+) Transcript_29153:1422-1757(+)